MYHREFLYQNLRACILSVGAYYLTYITLTVRSLTHDVHHPDGSVTDTWARFTCVKSTSENPWGLFVYQTLNSKTNNNAYDPVPPYIQMLNRVRQIS
jgi:hypothetical protein